MIYASLDNKKIIGEFSTLKVVAESTDTVGCEQNGINLPVSYDNGYWVATVPNFGNCTVMVNYGSTIWETEIEVTECTTYTVTPT